MILCDLWHGEKSVAEAERADQESYEPAVGFGHDNNSFD